MGIMAVIVKYYLYFSSVGIFGSKPAVTPVNQQIPQTEQEAERMIGRLGNVMEGEESKAAVKQMGGWLQITDIICQRPVAKGLRGWSHRYYDRDQKTVHRFQSRTWRWRYPAHSIGRQARIKPPFWYSVPSDGAEALPPAGTISHNPWACWYYNACKKRIFEDQKPVHRE